MVSTTDSSLHHSETLAFHLHFAPSRHSFARVLFGYNLWKLIRGVLAGQGTWCYSASQGCNWPVYFHSPPPILDPSPFGCHFYWASFQYNDILLQVGALLTGNQSHVAESYRDTKHKFFKWVPGGHDEQCHSDFYHLVSAPIYFTNIMASV